MRNNSHLSKTVNADPEKVGIFAYLKGTFTPPPIFSFKTLGGAKIIF